MDQKKKSTAQKQQHRIQLVEGPTSLGDGSFKEQSALYGLEQVKATQFYNIDFDLDGYDDLVILPEFYSIPHFYRFDVVKAKFVELDYNPFKKIIRASYLAFADFNGDHILDVIVGVFNQQSSMNKEPLKLYLGSMQDGHYWLQEKKDAFGKSSIGPNAAITLIDYNLDGYLDVYVARWFDVSSRHPVLVPDAFYQGNKDLKFKDVSFIFKDELLYDQNSGYYMATPTMGVTTCDINKDGYLDILTSATAGYPNKLWLNVRFPTGGRAYLDIGKQSNYAQDGEGKLLPKRGGNSLFSLCLDYNNDGLMDVVSGELSHSYDPEYRDRSSVLTGSLPQQVKFIRSEYYRDDGTLSWNQADRRGISFDYNGDGLEDFVVENSGFPPKSRLILFEQLEDHSYQDVAKKVGIDVLNPSGTIYVDVNLDGKLDILTGHSPIRRSQIERRLFLFTNQNKDKSRYLRIILNSNSHFNTYAIGAWIELQTSLRNYIRPMSYWSGAQSSQLPFGAFFTLRPQEQIKRLVIHWPFRDAQRRPVKQVITGRGLRLQKDYTVWKFTYSKNQ